MNGLSAKGANMTAILKVAFVGWVPIFSAVLAFADDQHKAQGEEALKLSAQAKDSAFSKHLPWGIPGSLIGDSLEQLVGKRLNP